MGMPLVVLLLLLLLGSVAVKPRTLAVRHGVAGLVGVLLAVLLAAMLLGYVHWGWDTGAGHR
jgi:hypothetical protein